MTTLTKEAKTQIISEYARSEGDTGSAEVQVVPSADSSPATSRPSGLVTTTASKVPSAALTTTGSSTEAPVAASPGVLVIDARLVGAALDDCAALACPEAAGTAVVMVVTAVGVPAVQAATVSVAVSAAAIRNGEVRGAGMRRPSGRSTGCRQGTTPGLAWAGWAAG